MLRNLGFSLVIILALSFLVIASPYLFDNSGQIVGAVSDQAPVIELVISGFNKVKNFWILSNASPSLLLSPAGARNKIDLLADNFDLTEQINEFSAAR